MTEEKQLNLIKERIEAIKQELLLLNDLRPGSLTTQYTVCGKKTCRCCDPKKPKKHGPYYHLSFSLDKGKQHTTAFIRKAYASTIENELKNYKTLKLLIDEWIQLGIEVSTLKMLIAQHSSS